MTKLTMPGKNGRPLVFGPGPFTIVDHVSGDSWQCKRQPFQWQLFVKRKVLIPLRNMTIFVSACIIFNSGTFSWSFYQLTALKVACCQFLPRIWLLPRTSIRREGGSKGIWFFNASENSEQQSPRKGQKQHWSGMLEIPLATLDICAQRFSPSAFFCLKVHSNHYLPFIWHCYHHCWCAWCESLGDERCR